jgi:RNA polymerase sigma-70 factor (ECF subfamily)
MAEATGPSPVTDDDASVFAALRRGDEQAFTRLVDRYYAPMVHVAHAYVATNEAAEDAVQDAWTAIIEGLDRFEGRSSLKTWLFRVVINKAMTTGGREARSVPLSSVGPDESSVDPTLFKPSGRWSGWWLTENAVTDLPDRFLLAKETRAVIDAVIATLPANQRLVITLRDGQGFSAEEACHLLDVSGPDQRVLLHQARTRVRAALQGCVTEGARAEP